MELPQRRRFGALHGSSLGVKNSSKFTAKPTAEPTDKIREVNSMRRSLIASTTAAILVLASGAAGLAGSFNPDPTGQFEVLRSVGKLSAAQQDAVFERIMAGGNLCAPELYVDAGTGGVLAVTLLSTCHVGQAVTLLCDGASRNIQMSNNGAVFITLAGAQKIALVQAVFADGTRVQTSVRGVNLALKMASND